MTDCTTTALTGRNLSRVWCRMEHCSRLGGKPLGPKKSAAPQWPAGAKIKPGSVQSCSCGAAIYKAKRS